VRALRTELERIVTASDRPASFLPCGPGTITITLRNDPPADEPSALGAIRQLDGRLIPQIELYIRPTASIIRTCLPAVLHPGARRHARTRALAESGRSARTERNHDGEPERRPFDGPGSRPLPASTW